MTIWTFGDSYSRYNRPSRFFPNLTDSWIERVVRRLDQPLVSNSKPLFALEHVYYHFDRVRENILPNDIVIITLTDTDRRWYWRNHPLQILQMTDEEKEALEEYKESLSHCNEIQETYVTNFLHNLNTVTKKLNLHTILLPSYYDSDQLIKPLKEELNAIHYPNLDLNTVSFNEFISDPTKMGLAQDNRVNHLCRNNHIVLANKIIDNIINKVPIDLTTGFESNFLDKELLEDPEFVKDQLFNGLLIRLQKIKLKPR